MVAGVLIYWLQSHLIDDSCDCLQELTIQEFYSQLFIKILRIISDSTHCMMKIISCWSHEHGCDEEYNYFIKSNLNYRICKVILHLKRPENIILNKFLQSDE